MDRAAVEQLLDEMLSSLEDLETKAGATLQFLKDKGHATDKDLAPYLEQAGNASNVRWRAARLRMMSLLGSALKNVEPAKEETKVPADHAKTADAGRKTEAEGPTTAQTGLQPQNKEPQPKTQTKESHDKQSSTESTEPSQPRSLQDQASVSEEAQPGADAKSTVREPKPSAPEEAGKTPKQADGDVPPRSKEDAA